MTQAETSETHATHEADEAVRVVDPDELATLEEERSFLLRSLRDLDRERAAGDLDEADYLELKDGYTSRAAAVLRAIEAGTQNLPPKRKVSWKRRLTWAGGAAVAIGVVSVVLVTTMSDRSAGQTASGLDPRSKQQQLLAQARDLQATDPAGAVTLYDQVLADEPDNVEALTYKGWTQMIALFSAGTPGDDAVDQVKSSIDSLNKAIELNPDYPDPHCFLAISYANFLQLPEEAQPEVNACLEAGPPADVRGMVEGLKARIDAQLASAPEGEPSASSSN